MLNKKNLGNINKDIKMLDIKHIIFRNKYITSIQSRSKIQSIQNRFKLIKFDNNKKRQKKKPVKNKNTIVYMANIDILIQVINICFLFKDNVEYT